MQDTEKETRIKRLQYRANHRGIKEMDIILGRFATEELDGLGDEQVDDFERLMEEQDRDLLIWFTGEQPFPLEELQGVFDLVSTHLSERDFNA